MAWFFFKGKDKNFIAVIEKELKELEKDPYKALFVYNDQWLPIYGYAEESYFDGEFQEVLQVMEEAQKAFEKNLKTGILELIMSNFKTKVPFLAFRYGSFCVLTVREDSFYLVCVIDEFNGKVNIDKTEKFLREKLLNIVEKSKRFHPE
jgi:hypothetical protein